MFRRRGTEVKFPMRKIPAPDGHDEYIKERNAKAKKKEIMKKVQKALKMKPIAQAASKPAQQTK